MTLPTVLEGRNLPPSVIRALGFECPSAASRRRKNPRNRDYDTRARSRRLPRLYPSNLTFDLILSNGLHPFRGGEYVRSATVPFWLRLK